MPATPTVSIIISAYNRPLVIRFAINSVLASDFADWEMIVVGDGCNATRVFVLGTKVRGLPAGVGSRSA